MKRSINEIVRDSVRGVLMESSGMPSDEERAIQCLEFYARSMRGMLGGSLDQLRSTMVNKSLDVDVSLKEYYNDVIDYIDDMGDYGKKLLRVIERAEKYLRYLGQQSNS